MCSSDLIRFMRNLHLILFLFYLNIIFCNAQSIKLFNTDREISCSLINNIYQDKNGLIWVATEDGLNRYDGAKFTVYKHEKNNENSLMHNYVRYIFEDNKGRLFVGCYNGIQMYDPEKDCFSKPAIRNNGQKFNHNVNKIIQRKNGEMWLSGTLISTFDIVDDQIIITPIELPYDIQTTDNILEDKSENLWIVKDENRIYRFFPDGNVKEYLIEAEGLIITALGMDAQGSIFAGSIINGLFRFDEKSDRFISIPYNNKCDLPVKSIYQANQEETYITTDGQGIKIYNNRTKTISDSRFDNSYFDITKSKVHYILKDNIGNFWLAIYQKGIMMIPAQPNNFKYIGHKSINKNIIGSCYITTLCRDRNNTLWVGTDNDGLYAITEKGERKAHFSSSGNKSDRKSVV